MIRKPIPIEIKKFKRKIAQNIKVIRLISGLKGEDFAKKLNISRMHLHRLENATAGSVDFCFLYHMARDFTDLGQLFSEDMTKKG